MSTFRTNHLVFMEFAGSITPHCRKHYGDLIHCKNKPIGKHIYLLGQQTAHASSYNDRNTHLQVVHEILRNCKKVKLFFNLYLLKKQKQIQVFRFARTTNKIARLWKDCYVVIRNDITIALVQAEPYFICDSQSLACSAAVWLPADQKYPIISMMKLKSDTSQTVLMFSHQCHLLPKLSPSPQPTTPLCAKVLVL